MIAQVEAGGVRAPGMLVDEALSVGRRSAIGSHDRVPPPLSIGDPVPQAL